MSSSRQEESTSMNKGDETKKEGIVADGKNADPLTALNEECMIHVISFLWPSRGDMFLGRGEYLFLTQAMSFHLPLSAVSSVWRSFLKKTIVHIVPGIYLNIDNKFLDFEGIYASWLFQHKKVPIRSINCQHMNGHAFALKCLEGLDTNQITNCYLPLFLPDHEDSAILLGQRTLQDQVARCPVGILGLDMIIPEGCAGSNVEKFLSHELFRSSTVTVMSINLDLLSPSSEPHSLDGQFFFKTMQNFPSLKSLFLSSEQKSLVPLGDDDGAFYISSPSLDNLYFGKFCNGRVRFSLDCPMLKTLYGRAGMLDPQQFGPNLFQLHQQVTQAENIPEECIFYVSCCQTGQAPGAPISCPFHSLVGFERVAVMDHAEPNDNDAA